MDSHLSISNDIVSSKIHDKRDYFDFEIVNFPFLDGDGPRSTSYGVYIFHLIRLTRASSYVADFNTCIKLLTQKLLKQGYRYHKLRKTARLVVNPITGYQWESDNVTIRHRPSDSRFKPVWSLT